VVHSVKAAVDGAIAWAEKKVDDLSSEQNSAGPYTSQATCVTSDLDPIAGGLGAAAMPTQNVDGTEESVRAQNGKKEFMDAQNEENEREKKSAKDDGEDKKGKKH
jgi:hypothetical protein